MHYMFFIFIESFIYNCHVNKHACTIFFFYFRWAAGCRVLSVYRVNHKNWHRIYGNLLVLKFYRCLLQVFSKKVTGKTFSDSLKNTIEGILFKKHCNNHFNNLVQALWFVLECFRNLKSKLFLLKAFGYQFLNTISVTSSTKEKMMRRK